MIPLPPGNYVGMPAAHMLDEFASHVWFAFGEPPYLVGSATYSKQWRDVDVRMIMDDDKFDALFGERDESRPNGKLVAMELAFSALGKQMTGLPIDFQIQRQSTANIRHHGARMALGFIELRCAK